MLPYPLGASQENHQRRRYSTNSSVVTREWNPGLDSSKGVYSRMFLVPQARSRIGRRSLSRHVPWSVGQCARRMEQVPAELNLSAASRNVEESVLKSVADLRPAVMNTATGILYNSSVKPVQRTQIHLSSRAVNGSLPVLRPIIMLNQRTFGTNSCKA
jgi:hypothetical protein